jgi:hypothetical protein
MFRTQYFAKAVAILIATFAMCCAARGADTWMLVQAVGEVNVVGPGAKPVVARASTPLPDGSTIRTGKNGRAVLLRGRETIVMSPSSHVTLPSGPNRDISAVQQDSGTLLFKIGKKPEAHFEVNTPYLAAVVKGTTFTVKVTGDGASVHVLEGAVEVATPDRAHSILTRAGQISSVFAKAANDIFTTGAVVFGGGDSPELWGTETSQFEFSGDTAWTLSNHGNAFQSRGLRSSHAEPKRDVELTERASGRFAQAAKAVEQTMGAAAAQKRTTKPKDPSIKVVDSAAETTNEIAYASKDSKPSKADQRNKPLDGKEKPKGQPQSDRPLAKPANVWTVTQAKGAIKIDGYPFASFGDGLVRTLPPGTKVETGNDSKLAVAHGLAEFVIDQNSTVVLADAVSLEVPKVVHGAALRYEATSGKYVNVPNLSGAEVAELQGSGALDDAPSQEAASSSIQIGGGGASRNAVALGTRIDLPNAQMSLPSAGQTKTEEVRSKVLSGLTLGLYALTALLILAFGAQWAWRRYRSKVKEPPAETPAQARLRSIKGA